MGVNVAAYIERKNKETGKWELVTKDAISSRLKYLIDDYNELPVLNWDELSDGLKEKFKKDEDGNVWCNFHVTTLDDLEEVVSKDVKTAYVRINTIIKAMGVRPFYTDDGEESAWADDSDTSDKMTLPINKSLLEDLQYSISDIRKIGQREALDLIFSESVDYDSESRIVLAVV